MEEANKVALGSKVRDRISGFTGIATARAEYRDSAPRVFVIGETLSEGRIVEEWIEEARLEVQP